MSSSSTGNLRLRKLGTSSPNMSRHRTMGLNMSSHNSSALKTCKFRTNNPSSISPSAGIIKWLRFSMTHPNMSSLNTVDLELSRLNTNSQNSDNLSLSNLRSINSNTISPRTVVVPRHRQVTLTLCTNLPPSKGMARLQIFHMHTHRNIPLRRRTRV